MRWDAVPILLLGIVIIIVVARLLGALAKRLGQPAVIGEILGGILLGPTLFNGVMTKTLFPSDIRPALATLASIGVVVFMFLVGLDLDRDLLRGQGRIATSVSLSSVAVPFILGALLAMALRGRHPTDQPLTFMLFLGTAMAITAFPVLARILTDQGLIHTPIGGLALACAAVDDVLAWSALAIVAAMAGASVNPWLTLLVLPFAALLLFVVRPLLARLAARGRQSGRARSPKTRWITSVGTLLAVAAGLWLSAHATDILGLHLIFGAFLFGVIFPREGLETLRTQVLPWIRRACSTVLLPIFFMVVGLNVDLSELDGTALGELGAILLVAIVGKVAGAYFGARLNGIRPRHSTVLAVLINTRGLTELIVLTVGLQLNVLDRQLYSLMVVMALVTTAMAGVILPLVYPAHKIREDQIPHGTLAREQARSFKGDRAAR